MNSPEEHIKEQLEKFTGVVPYDDFSDIASAVAHKNNISLEKANDLLNWRPEIPFEKGIKDFFLWLKK